MNDRVFLQDVLERRDDGPYLTHLRMTRTTFEGLVHVLEENPVYKTDEFINAAGLPLKKQAPVREQVFVTLYWFAHGGTQAKACAALGICEGTLDRHVRRTTQAILELSSAYITFPTTEEELSNAAADFDNIHMLPGCVGILDGTRILITNKSESNAQYLNVHYGTNIAGAICCDAQGLITFASFGFPGRMHDSPIIQKTALSEQRLNLVRNKKYLIADSGYALAPWLITVFKDADAENNLERRNYNRFLSSRRALHCGFEVFFLLPPSSKSVSVYGCM
jgi:hypothetical protein